jgi:hypothetical protein
MKDFKDEMKDFKDEMKDFKDEMKDFKDEMKDFKKNANKQWGELANKMGTIVEDLISPSTIPTLERYFKCSIDYKAINIRKKLKKENINAEFDIVASSDECKKVFLIEVKSTPRKSYIDEFKEKNIELFKRLFNEYKSYEIIPMFASIAMDEVTIKYLTSKNIYALVYKDWDYMDILNFDEMKS